MGRDSKGSCGFYSPGGAIFDALRVIGELVVEELQEAISFFGCSEDSDLGVEHLNSVVPLSSNESSIAGRRRYQAEDGSAIGGSGGGERKRGSVGEDQLGKADDGNMVWSEVPVDTGVDPSRVVGAQLCDDAGKEGLLSQDERVVRVDRVR